jgi:uncharacterized protein
MSQPVHIAITRKVKPGMERDFEQFLSVFVQRSLLETGSRGVYCLYPPPDSGSNEYGILRSFSSMAAREAFYKSQLYREWLANIEPLVEGEPDYRELNGLEAWFRNSPRSEPPVWKMAVLTFVAVWPVSMAVPAALYPLIGSSVSNTIFAGAVALGIVVILTWVAMPVLVWITRPWLQPKRAT